jgi:hypothetical protein
MRLELGKMEAFLLVIWRLQIKGVAFGVKFIQEINLNTKIWQFSHL